VEQIRYFAEGGTLKKGVVVASGNPPQYNQGTEKVTIVVDNLTTDGEPDFPVL
jgi:hypothetical protein